MVPTDQLPAGVSAATVTLTDFANQGGDLVASGTATVTDTAGNQATQAFKGLEVLQADGTCDVLNLVLGPLHLDLLGLVIDLNQVVLNITAEQGPGNLLGSLLCAVAGLLDGPSPLGAIAELLDRILSILGRVLQMVVRSGRATGGPASDLVTDTEAISGRIFRSPEAVKDGRRLLMTTWMPRVSSGSAPQSLGGALKEEDKTVILCAIIKRIRDGIVVSDPHPQYSALDRMDGLSSASPKIGPAKPSHNPGR